MLLYWNQNGDKAIKTVLSANTELTTFANKVSSAVHPWQQDQLYGVLHYQTLLTPRLLRLVFHQPTA
jgi:hypothetical protein